jgi:hypothetical protein
MSTVSSEFTGPFKLIARQGLAIELPGQPLSSLAPTPLGLNSGEFALTVDTGDVYIGSNPNYRIFSDARYDRYPYANIHVLTESERSVLFIEDVFKLAQTQYSSIIVTSNTTAPIGTTDLVWDVATNNVAEVQYMLCFDGVPTAVRKGKVTIVMNQTEGKTHDSRTDVGFSYFGYTDPVPYENDTVFEFGVSVSNGIATMTYANNSSFNVKLYYLVVNLNAQF